MVACHLGGRLGMDCGRRWLGGNVAQRFEMGTFRVPSKLLSAIRSFLVPAALENGVFSSGYEPCMVHRMSRMKSTSNTMTSLPCIHLPFTR